MRRACPRACAAIGAEPHGAAEIAARARAAPARCRASIRSSGRRPARRPGRTRSSWRPRCRRACAPPRSPPSACRSRCRNTAPCARARSAAARILPSAPRSPKPPGTRMPWTCSRIGRRILALEDLAFDPLELDLHAVGDAAMHQRLDQRLVGVLQPGVLADDGDRDLALGVVDALGSLRPSASGRAWAPARCRRRPAPRWSSPSA